MKVESSSFNAEAFRVEKVELAMYFFLPYAWLEKTKFCVMRNALCVIGIPTSPTLKVAWFSAVPGPDWPAPLENKG